MYGSSERATCVADPPKKKRGRPQTGIDTEPVRVRSEILEWAKYVAIARKMKPGQLISEMVAKQLEREYKALMKKNASESE